MINQKISAFSVIVNVFDPATAVMAAWHINQLENKHAMTLEIVMSVLSNILNGLCVAFELGSTTSSSSYHWAI